MPRVMSTVDSDGSDIGQMIFCPACQCGHLFNTVPGSNGVGGQKPVWTYNGDAENPTFTPSMLVKSTEPLTDAEADRVMAGEVVKRRPSTCHSHVRDGKIQYLNDCTHALKGQTVDLPGWNTMNAGGK